MHNYNEILFFILPQDSETDLNAFGKEYCDDMYEEAILQRRISVKTRLFNNFCEFQVLNKNENNDEKNG